MTSSLLLSLITFVYGLAAVLYIISAIFKNKLSGKIATWVTVTGAAGNLIGIILRWIESYQLGIGHAPFANKFESFIFFSLTIAVIYLITEFKYKNRIIGIVALPLAFLSMAYASLPIISDQLQPHVSGTIHEQLKNMSNLSYAIEPLIPALKSNWLITHVIACFLGYAGFSVAFGISIIYLLKQSDTTADGENALLSLLPESTMLDELNHQMVIFGFFFLSIGIITGAVWANTAWGRYWGWDPKETWSLITWFIYASLLHARLVRGWHGKRIALLSIIGFLAVIFTYIGVNTLPQFDSLHSYG